MPRARTSLIPIRRLGLTASPAAHRPPSRTARELPPGWALLPPYRHRHQIRTTAAKAPPEFPKKPAGGADDRVQARRLGGNTFGRKGNWTATRHSVKRAW